MSRPRPRWLPALALLWLLTAAAPSPAAADASGAARPTSTPPLADEYLVLHTVAGDIAIALYPTVAPKHVVKVLELARLGVYDGNHFYRVHPNFVAQVADTQDRLTPLTPEQERAVVPLPLEVSDIKHRVGHVSMARNDDPNSARSSFSIILGDAPHLDGKYTIFGHVIAGGAVLDKILEVPALPPQYQPIARITIDSAEVVSAADFDSDQLAPARTVPISELDQGKVALRKAQAQPLVIYGLLLMLLIGVAQFALARRLAPRKLRSLGLVNVLICGFLVIVTVAPVALHRSLDPDDQRLIGLLVFFGLLALIKLMGRFESPN
ncbi:MAG: hypothetical protein Tsb0020_40890 [Haliangiales bacterium]